MSLFGPVDAKHKLCRHEVAQVLHSVRRGVSVVVATFSMVTEAVGVLHTQVQTLDTKQINDQKNTNGMKSYSDICREMLLHSLLFALGLISRET